MDAGLTSLLQALPSDDAPAIISGTASLTYAMLHQAVAALETSLAPIIHPADVVGVCTPHGIELTLLVLALHARQATVFLAHHGLSDHELQGLIAHEHAAAVICERPRAGIGLAAVRVPNLPDQMALHLRSDRRPPHQAPEAPTLHLYTSGTDGRLKGVIRDVQGLAWEGAAIAAKLGLRRTTRVLCPVPVCHAYGFGMGVLGLLASGGTLILDAPPTPHLLHRSIIQHRPDIVIAVPALYDLWSRGPRQEPPPDTLQLCVSSGAPLSPTVAEAFERSWDRRIARQYGMSECGPIAIDLACSPEPTCVGTPYPGVHVWVDTDEAAEDDAGELVVTSRFAGAGYVGGFEHDAVPNPFSDRGIRTGDQGFFDSAGRIHLVSRKTGLINVHGQKVDPTEVESVMATYPGVEDVVVLGVEQPDQDQWIVAFVVVHAEVRDRDIEWHCRQRLASFKRPRQLIRVAAIPRTPTGKPRRVELLALLRRSSASPMARADA